MDNNISGSFVGIFYVIDITLFCEKTEISNAEKYGANLTHEGSHDWFWNKYLKKLDISKKVEFDYYPRGRVIYDIKGNKFKIFIDKCINNSKLIDEIKNEFKLNSSVIIYDNDEHYVCHKCNKFYIDM